MKKIIFCLVFLLSCNPTPCKKTYQALSNQIELNDLSKNLFDINSQKEFSDFLILNSDFLIPFFELGTPLVQEDVSQVYSLIDNVYYDSLYFDVKKTYGDFSLVHNELNNSFHIYNNQSNIKFQPHLNIIVSGFFNDLLVSKNSISVGIEYFLKKGNKYKPSDLPDYILDRYTPSHLNPTLLTAFFSQFNIIDESDKTMLNEMIAYGKLYYIVEKISDCVQKNIILGYDLDQYKTLEENEAFIYSYFIQNELFFEEQQKEKQKYISERPRTYEISSQLPGRIGRWLGWKIVHSYMAENEVTLEELLIEKDFKKVFYNSNYKPS